MRDSNSGTGSAIKDKKPGEGGSTVGDSNHKSDGTGNASTDISPEKPITNQNTDDISPEGLLEVISQEWKNEMERIKTLGLNGYKRRKESRNECLV